MTASVALCGVRTWYDEHGEREAAPLHPGMADVRAFALNSMRWRRGATSSPRSGAALPHPGSGRAITDELTATDTIAFLERWSGAGSLVACSDAVAVALLVVLHRPDQARRMVLVAWVFHRDGWHPETTDVDPLVTSTLDGWHPAAWTRGRTGEMTAAAPLVRRLAADHAIRLRPGLRAVPPGGQGDPTAPADGAQPLRPAG